MVLGVAGVLALALDLIALVADVAIPLAIAVVLAAVLVPLTDRLERWRLPRWLGATFVLILALSMVVATVAVVVGGLTSQSDEIWAQLQGALDQVEDERGSSRESPTGCRCGPDVVRLLGSGLLGTFFSSASSFVVGSVLAIFMLLFLLKDWAADHRVDGRPPGAPSGRWPQHPRRNRGAFRGYAAGLTLIGAANAAVVSSVRWCSAFRSPSPSPWSRS